MCEASSTAEAILLILTTVLAGLLFLAKDKIRSRNAELELTNRLVKAYKTESISSSRVIDNLKEVTEAQRKMITFLEDRVKTLSPEEPEEDNGYPVDNFG